MLLATLRRPPRAGSLQEKVLSEYVLLREQAEHARFRALAQAIIDKEKAVETFEEYMAVAFPWVSRAKERRTSIAKQIMDREFAAGPLKIEGQLMKRKDFQSRMAERIQNTKTYKMGQR